VDTEPESTNDKIVTITADGPMVIDQAGSKAIFKDNVVARQGGRTLRADVMEVYFDQEMSQVNQLICIGNVEIMQGENKTFAEKAVYDAQHQKITLSGRPKMIFITEGEGSIESFRD